MPKDTFFNLDQEKRSMIERVAIDEFAEYGYDIASVNRIIKECRIAKGSFYQYFEDKLDLFKYLMQRMAEEKIKYISDVMKNPSEVDFFTLIRELYLSGLRFAHANSKLVTIGNRILKDKDNPVYKEIMGENMTNAYGVFEGLLKQAIAKGEIREDIDVKFVSYIISSMNVATLEYYQDICIDDSVENEKWDEGIMETVNKFLEFVKYGIKASN
ncbi:TetR/AcrR family transcriptional regulator [Clostridium sp. DL1XJH146]